MVTVTSITGIVSNAFSGAKKTNVLKRLYNAVPNFDVVSDKFITHVENFGKKCTSAHQRGILGATALVTQPFIDAKNKSVDEKTRKFSVARTIAKILAGTLTGVLIRYGCIKAMGLKAFRPARWDKVSKDVQDQYKNAMGTIVSLVIMMFTNFMIDAPLTKFLTNAMISSSKEGQDSGGDKK